MKNNFCIYVILDPRKPGNYQYGEYKFDYEPFYVGMSGKIKRRLAQHLRESFYKNVRNKLKANKIKKLIHKGLDPIFKILYKQLIKENAIKLEIDLIKKIGRINLELGLLTNLTDGGDIIINLSKESKQKHRENCGWSLGMRGPGTPNYGHKHTEENKRKWSEMKKGIKFTEEHKKKIGQSNKGKHNYPKLTGKDSPQYGYVASEETKQKLRLVRKGKFGVNATYAKYWKVINPQNQEQIIRNLLNFCNQNNLNYSTMANIAAGRQKSHRGGWKCKHFNKKDDKK